MRTFDGMVVGVWVIAAAASLSGCKRSRSASPPPDQSGEVIGKLEVRPGELGLVGAARDTEPNDRAWNLQPAELRDRADLAVRGTVGGSGDPLDLHAFTAIGAGWVAAVAAPAASIAETALLVLPGGRLPARGFAVGTGRRAALLAAGDIVVLAAAAPTPSSYEVHLGFSAQRTAPPAVELAAFTAAAWLAQALPMADVVAGAVSVLADDAAAVDAAAAGHGCRRELSGGRGHLLRLPAAHAARRDGAALLELLVDLRVQPGILAASPSFQLATCGARPLPNDPLFPQQWNLDMLQVPQAWAATTGSDQVVLAFVDTGADAAHPELASRLTTYGYDFVDGRPGFMDPNPGPSHGLQLVGVAAAQTDNAAGIAGIDWRAKALPVRAVGGAAGTAELAQGVLYAAGLANSSGTVLDPTQRAQVIDISVATTNDDPVLADAVRQASAQGVVVVAAVGNFGGPTVTYPAAYDDVIGVGAVHRDGSLWSNGKESSSTGPMVDVVAPGDRVLTTDRDQKGGYYYFIAPTSGTSIAAAQVTGVIGLMRAANPRLTPRCALSALRRTARDLGPGGADPAFGAGLVDAAAAVAAARGLDLELEMLRFESPLRLAARVRVESCEAGGGALTVTGAPAWLSVSVSSTTLPATIAVQVLPENLTRLDRSATLTVTSDVGTRELRIELEPALVWGEVATVLLSAPSGDVLARARARASEYRLGGLRAGEYRIQAGIDNNGDGRLDDPGDNKSTVVTFQVKAGLNEGPVLVVN